MASPAVLRLVHHATGYTNSVPAAGAGGPQGDAPADNASITLDPCDVVLVCRIGSEPYVWAGTLEYVRHDPRSSPIKFWWRLRDFASLVSKSEFQRVLLVAAGEAPD